MGRVEKKRGKVRKEFKTREFDTEILIDLAHEYEGEVIEYCGDEYELMVNKQEDNDRWSINFRMVFRHLDKFYEVWYSRGATEYQDEQPFDHSGDTERCYEVEPVEVTVTKYKKIAL